MAEFWTDGYTVLGQCQVPAFRQNHIVNYLNLFMLSIAIGRAKFCTYSKIIKILEKE